MTLNDFFDFLNQHPVYTLAYLIIIPILAGVIGIIADDKSHLDPWRYFYMLLIYLICIPGIFSVTLLLYSLIFEQRSVYNIDVITQVLPIISMIVTILATKKYVALDDIPGFGKLTGLIMMITVILILLWILQKTRILMFTFLPFQYVLLILIALILIFRFGMKKMF